MTTTQKTEQNVYSKISELRDEHQDELSSTENSNLNNSVEYLCPKELKSDLEFNKKVERSNRKLSAPNLQILKLTLNQVNAGNRLRYSYIDRLMCKGLLSKC
jgi:hypothetical protein